MAHLLIMTLAANSGHLGESIVCQTVGFLDEVPLWSFLFTWTLCFLFLLLFFLLLLLFLPLLCCLSSADVHNGFQVMSLFYIHLWMHFVTHHLLLYGLYSVILSESWYLIFLPFLIQPKLNFRLNYFSAFIVHNWCVKIFTVNPIILALLECNQPFNQYVC